MTHTTDNDINIEYLKKHIKKNGPIPAVRTSSAQARGIAKQYLYWGTVRYEVRLRKKDGELIAAAIERASSDRRSRRLAEEDTEQLAQEENRVIVDTIGAFDGLEAWWIRRQLEA